MDSFLPVDGRAELTEGGDDPRLEFSDCVVSGLMPVDLGGGVVLKCKLIINNIIRKKEITNKSHYLHVATSLNNDAQLKLCSLE